MLITAELGAISEEAFFEAKATPDADADDEQKGDTEIEAKVDEEQDDEEDYEYVEVKGQ